MKPTLSGMLVTQQLGTNTPAFDVSEYGLTQLMFFSADVSQSHPSPSYYFSVSQERIFLRRPGWSLMYGPAASVS